MCKYNFHLKEFISCFFFELNKIENIRIIQLENSRLSVSSTQ